MEEGKEERRDWFEDHYVDWREKRIATVVKYYEKDFFRGKRILELGCGYADIGARFLEMGATVTCSDGRGEHLEVVKRRHPNLITVQADLDMEWPFNEQYEIIINFGVLYHLRNPGLLIENCCNTSNTLILETVVCDSPGENLVLYTKEDGYDQALNGIGSRPSTRYVEKKLRECGMVYDRVIDARCNSGPHQYDWLEPNTTVPVECLRRFWFAEKEIK